MSIGHKCDSCASPCPGCIDADLLIYRINHAYYVNYSRPGSVTVAELMELLTQIKRFLEGVKSSESTAYEAGYARAIKMVAEGE